MFTPNNSLTLTTVTWMKKEPYQHVVTFRAQSSGSWTAVNAGNRYEFVGNPKKGDVSIRINQLNMEDNHTYLCLVEYTGPSNYQYLIQNETWLHTCCEDFTRCDIVHSAWSETPSPSRDVDHFIQGQNQKGAGLIRHRRLRNQMYKLQYKPVPLVLH
ncbi:sialic acid-binding Ig-like lectin 15 [Cetorhinus maximus]